MGKGKRNRAARRAPQPDAGGSMVALRNPPPDVLMRDIWWQIRALDCSQWGIARAEREGRRICDAINQSKET